MEVLAMIFVILIAILAIVFLVAVVNYILTAIAVYKVAQRKGIDHAFLAWIPIAQIYLYAELIGTNVKIGNVTIPQYPWIYTGVIVLGNSITSIIQYSSNYATYASTEQFADHVMEAGANLATSMGSLAAALIAGLVGLIILVVRVYTMYRVFKLFKGNNAILFTVLGAFIPLSMPIVLLVLSGKPFADEPEAVPAPYSA